VWTIGPHENVAEDHPFSGTIVTVFLEQLRFGPFGVVAQLLQNIGLPILLGVLWSQEKKIVRHTKKDTYLES